MNTITEYWYLIVIGISLVGAGIKAFIIFYKEPKENKIKAVKEALKEIVFKAEKKYGEKTGQLKLRHAYNLAVAQFPWLPELVPFELFSDWVDDALEWMNHYLDTNEMAKICLEDINEDE